MKDYIIEKDGDTFKTHFIPEVPEEESKTPILNALWQAYRYYKINNYGQDPDYFLMTPHDAIAASNEFRVLRGYFPGEVRSFLGVPFLRTLDLKSGEIKAVGSFKRS